MKLCFLSRYPWHPKGFKNTFSFRKNSFCILKSIPITLSSDPLVSGLEEIHWYCYMLWCLQELAEEIGSSRAFVQTIAEDSADIVSVIRRAYEVQCALCSSVHMLYSHSHNVAACKKRHSCWQRIWTHNWNCPCPQLQSVSCGAKTHAWI